MGGRIDPVCHRQYLLRRTLQQGRKPTAREGLFFRLADINARRRIYHWSHTCRRPMCHAHHLLLLLFARFAYVSPHHPFVATSYLEVRCDHVPCAATSSNDQCDEYDDGNGKMVLQKPHMLASPLLLPLALWRWYVVSLSLFCSPIWPGRMAR